MRLAATAAVLLALHPAATSVAQSGRSLTDSDNGILLAQGAAITVPDAQGEVSAEALQEKILLLRSTINSLTESLAIANAEAEMFKRQATELTVKIEALGVAGMENDPRKIEQRLLAAVSDLRLLKKQNQDAVDQLVRLTEAIQVLIKSTAGIDPKVRLAVETELRKAGEILGAPKAAGAEAVEATLNDGMVIDVKENLSLIVANIGEKHGVRIGMPFQVLRSGKLIGTARIVDVRERISGAIIQSLESEKNPIQKGDRLKVDARQ